MAVICRMNVWIITIPWVKMLSAIIMSGTFDYTKYRFLFMV